MSIPKYNEMFPSILKCLNEPGTHRISDLRDKVARDFSLTEEDLRITIPSGGSLFGGRVGWARTYLKRAGLIDTPERNRYVLTESGRKAVAEGAEHVDLKYLEQFESFRKFIGKSASSDPASPPPAPPEPGNESPEEIIEEQLRKMNSALAADLMEKVMAMQPYDFEKLVITLLIAMGYGRMEHNPNAITPESGDGGIDGIVNADRFGFDAVYTQAKRWDPASTIGRPEIQKFMGALTGVHADKGLFITTAKFSSNAIEYARSVPYVRIRLVDGTMLMNLMIEYNVGVTTAAVYKAKSIDMDFFE